VTPRRALIGTICCPIVILRFERRPRPRARIML
jgi:hypothetical protein